MTTELKNLKIELRLELQNILEYWMTHTIDSKNGGFIGQIDFENNRNEWAGSFRNMTQGSHLIEHFF